MRRIVVIGTGGLAREFTAYFCEDSDDVEIVGYSSRNQAEHEQFGLPGAFFAGDITPDLVGTAQAVIAIGNPSIRKMVAEELSASGFSFPAFVHPTSVVSKKAAIEDGVVVFPNCVVSPNVTLKSFAWVNFSCGVGHDATVGRYVQINPGSQLGGGSVIGDGCLIGSGAVILQGIAIGTNATVASGSVVFSRIPENARVMGYPATRMPATLGSQK